MKVTIIGAGNMGGAIARGLAKGSLVSASDITCAERNRDILNNLKVVIPSVNVSFDNAESVKGSDIVIIAVKPWIVEAVVNEIKSSLDFNRQAVISIAAGVTFDQLHGFFGTDKVSLFRVIPNTAIDVLNSMTLVSANPNATKEQTDTVVSIFNELGCAMLIEERLMAAGTSLASCGIAFAMRYIRAAIEGGVELGFYPSQAQEIVLNTVKGAAELLLANGTNPEVEIDKVTTPGGITIKGLNEMEHAGFTSAVIKGLKASR